MQQPPHTTKKEACHVTMYTSVVGRSEKNNNTRLQWYIQTSSASTAWKHLSRSGYKCTRASITTHNTGVGEGESSSIFASSQHQLRRTFAVSFFFVGETIPVKWAVVAPTMINGIEGACDNDDICVLNYILLLLDYYYDGALLLLSYF